LDTLDEIGVGSIVFSPLAQGMLTDKYLHHIPQDSRASQSKSLQTKFLSEENRQNIQALHAIAQRRGQSLAQMAIAWVFRKQQVTSALIGASKPQQVLDCVGSLKNLSFTPEEIHEIDLYAKDGHINIWAQSAEINKG